MTGVLRFDEAHLYGEVDGTVWMQCYRCGGPMDQVNNLEHAIQQWMYHLGASHSDVEEGDRT